jgi:formiminoglutamate deiminase
VTDYFAPAAWIDGAVAFDVRLTVVDGRFSAVTAGDRAEPADVRLPGLVFPGFANTHSHAFHRALRGRTQDGGGTFWTWRERMYAVADRLDPESYLALARAVFAEMVLAGVTSVGEFHYLHHARGGVPYDDPNAMGLAVTEAARQAGIRITLLDTCYLAGGLTVDGHLPLDEHQRPFGDGSATGWADRVAKLGGLGPHAMVGAAIHSVRAVPREEIPLVVQANSGRPLHVHLSEQPAENEACRAFYGVTPTALLRAAGALGPRTTAVHATHLSDADIAALGETGTTVSFCPTTERDLADGIGPARRLLEAGAPLVVGSDQHAVIDLLEEVRAMEMNERLASLERGRIEVGQLVEALTSAGQRSIGWDDAGRLEVGARADLVAVRLDTVRTAGSALDQLVFAATAADVDTVMVDGVLVVQGGVHALGDVAALLTDAIAPLSP